MTYDPRATGELHAAINARDWHAARAHDAREAATAPGITPDGAEYLTAMAAWHQQRADVAAKLIEQARKETTR